MLFCALSLSIYIPIIVEPEFKAGFVDFNARPLDDIHIHIHHICVFSIVVWLLRHSSNEFVFDTDLRLSEHYVDCHEDFFWFMSSRIFVRNST